MQPREVKMLLLLLVLWNGGVSSAWTISCVGDSITEEGGASHPSNSYPSVLQELLPSSYDVKNFGRSGATMIEHPDDSYRERDEYEDALESNPDVVTIMLGTNDAKGEFWDDDSSDEYVESYEDLVRTFRDLGATVVVMIPVPQLKASSKWPDPDVINDEIPRLVEQVADDLGAPLVDMRVPLLVDGEVDDDLYEDSIHPNDQGNEKMAAHLKQQLESLGLLDAPTYSPTRQTTYEPTASKTTEMTQATYAPTTTKPTKMPTYSPTAKPSTLQPTYSPTIKPTPRPSSTPSQKPTFDPTRKPTTKPSTAAPSKADLASQTLMPSPKPTSSNEPTGRPSITPSTSAPTRSPSLHFTPTTMKTREPTTRLPSQPPSIAKVHSTAPSRRATPRPSTPSPSQKPSSHPSSSPPSSSRTSTPSATRLLAISSSVSLVTSLNASRFNSDSEIKDSFATALVETTSAVEVSNLFATSRRRLQASSESSLTIDFDALVVENLDFDVDVRFLSALSHPAFADALLVETKTSKKKKNEEPASAPLLIAVVIAAIVLVVIICVFAWRNRNSATRCCCCCTNPLSGFHSESTMKFKDSEASLSDSDKDLFDDVHMHNDEERKPDVTPSQYADFFGLKNETKEQYYWEAEL